jgi:hypothetical protein
MKTGFPFQIFSALTDIFNPLFPSIKYALPLKYLLLLFPAKTKAKHKLSKLSKKIPDRQPF